MNLFLQEIIKNPQLLMIKVDCVFENFLRLESIEKKISDFKILIFNGNWSELRNYLEKKDNNFKWGHLSTSETTKSIIKGEGLYHGISFDTLQKNEKDFLLNGIYAFYLSHNLLNIGNKAIVANECHEILGSTNDNGYEAYIKAHVKKHGKISNKRANNIQINWTKNRQERADNFSNKLRSIFTKLSSLWIDGPDNFKEIESSLKEVRPPMHKHKTQNPPKKMTTAEDFLEFIESQMPKTPIRTEDKATESEEMMLHKDELAESAHQGIPVTFTPDEKISRLKELREREEKARVDAIQFYRDLFSK